MAYYAVYAKEYHAAYLPYKDAWWIYENNGRSIQTVGYADTQQEIESRAADEGFTVIFDI